MSIVEKALRRTQSLSTKLGAADRTSTAQALEPLEAARVVGMAPPPGGAPISHRHVPINLESLRAAGVLPPPPFERQLAEQFRRIKRPLVAHALSGSSENFGPDEHFIMVASAFPGEGKTFTSTNLAISLAREKDVSVLLIDADMAKPQLSELFGMSGELGLVDALSNESLDAELLIVDTDVPGLSFLSAGAERGAFAELLASARMNTVMAALVARDRTRLIVLDSPPLLLTNESRELTRKAGQIVLVVRAGVTPQDSVLEAIQLIPDGKHAGIVLNQVDPSSADMSYAAYGGYGGYGGYGAHANTGEHEA